MNQLQKLNPQATIIFCQLWERLSHSVECFNCGHVRIENDPHSPLLFKIANSRIPTPLGKGSVYSLAHTHLDGTRLVCEPEMTFFVMDNRSHPKDYDSTIILPLSYRDTVGLFQRSLLIEDQEWAFSKIHAGLTEKLTSLANDWLTNIHAQGYLETKWILPE
jgi:hypothetical protein